MNSEPRNKNGIASLATSPPHLHSRCRLGAWLSILSPMKGGYGGRAKSSLALIIGLTRCAADAVPLRLFIAVLVLLNWTNGTIRTSEPRVQNSARKSATNSFMAGAEMKIKRAIATIAILGGLASLAYAQRPSAICPVHDVSGHPTGAPIDAKGQCEYEHSMDGGNSIHHFRASCYY
jgi:hypothetical protein